MNLFKTKPLLGLDIKPHEIRLIELKRSNQKLCLTRALYMSLPNTSRIDGDANKRILADYLAQLVKENNLQGYNVALALPHQNILSKRLKLPKYLTDEEIYMIIKENLERYFPKTSDLYFDFMREELKDSENAEIFVFAVQKNYVDSYSNLIHYAGMHLASVDVDTLVLMRTALFVGEVSQNFKMIENVEFNFKKICPLIFAKCEYSNNYDRIKFKESANDFLISFGLALRGLNGGN